MLPFSIVVAALLKVLIGANPKVLPEPEAARGESRFRAGRSGASSPGDMAVVGMEEAGLELLSLLTQPLTRWQ